MNKIFLLLLALNLTQSLQAQNSADSVSVDTKRKLRTYSARNFSQERTFNLFWEATPNYDYTLTHDGQTLESGRIKAQNLVKVSAKLPVVDKQRFTLSVKGNANFLPFRTRLDGTVLGRDGLPANVLKADDIHSYSYYRGEVQLSYIFQAWGKPLVLRGSMGIDGWNHGVEYIDARLVGILMLKRSRTTTLGLGLTATTRFDQVPALPIILYSRQLAPSLTLDATLPSHLYFRYQFLRRHRLSAGTKLGSEQLYMHPGMASLPHTMLYKCSTIKGELAYEFIVNDHFYFIARSGVSKPIKHGLYKISGKGDGHGDPLVSMTKPLTPFLYLGFSYNIFK